MNPLVAKLSVHRSERSQASERNSACNIVQKNQMAVGWQA